MSKEGIVANSFIRSTDQAKGWERRSIHTELTIHGLFLTLRRQRATILGVISVCFLLGVIVSAVLKPRYKAIGEIQIQKSATDGLGLENLAGPKQESTADALEANIELQTQANILESYSLALKVIHDLNLENTDDFRPSTFNPIGSVKDLLIPGILRDPPNAALDDAPRRRDRIVKVFEKHLKVKPQPGTQLIDIQYTSTDPKIAAAVVNDLAKSLVDYTLNSRATATSEVSTWLTGQLGEIKKDAEQQQGKLEQLQRDSGVYSLGIPDAAGKEMAYSATLDRLQQATQELSAATSNRILKGALYKTIEKGDPEMISGLAGSSLAGSSPTVNNSFLLLQNLRTQQAALASQLAADTSKYGYANPKLGDEKASLDSINTEIRSEIHRIGERALNDYKTAQVTEDSTRTMYEQARKSADLQNNKAIALFIAREEATDARSLYQTLYSHLKAAGVIEGLRSSNVAVVDKGRIPSQPVPYTLIIPALSLLIGSFIGIAIALLADATNDRIEEMETIENLLHTQILAILPLTQIREATRGIGSKVIGRLSDGDDGNEVGRVEVLDGPNSAYVEALRGLRTSLLLPRRGAAAPPRTILITSAGEKEGKSTLSLNLAAALVLNGSRVLLVDGDLRSSGLSAYMGLGKRGDGLLARQPSGLSEALASVDEPAVVQPFPELPNLSALPAGSSSKYPAELLGSPRLRTLLKTWEANYDFVLIDSPPILAVADAVILSRLSDSTLLVTRHGRSTQKSLERAYRTLHDVEGGQVGVVVNGVRRNSTSYDEFYGYKGNMYYREA